MNAVALMTRSAMASEKRRFLSNQGDRLLFSENTGVVDLTAGSFRFPDDIEIKA